MKNVGRRNSLLFITIIYIVSWLVPISIIDNHFSNYMGYEGAEQAQKILSQGIVYFKDAAINNAELSIKRSLKELFNIIGGLPNILFIFALLLASKNNKYSFHFIAPCVLVMLLWSGGKIIIGGYTLWLFSGAWLLFISFKTYKETFNKPNIALLISTPLFITYFIAILGIAVHLLY